MEFHFGPFTLLPARKLLLRDGEPVRLGQRALDILLILVSRAGEVVAKTDILDQVWPGLHVEETNLRVQVSALRKALGDSDAPARFVRNVAGRGYAFVAPVSPGAAPAPPAGLPGRISAIIGRDDEIEAISQQVMARRFVTLTGAGGIGKTTVALAVARRQAERGGQPVYFVDLGVLRQDSGAVETIAAALNLKPGFSSSARALAGALTDRRMLLVLDCCETVIDAAAQIVETILAVAPHVHILATSREPLRAEGEWVWRLASFDTPVHAGQLNADEAMELPAIQLFAERAAAAGGRFVLTDADVALVADICRRLEGIPLAIEFAAGQLHALGLQELAARLDARFSLLMKGRRTALPRHQTLRATLDWSFGLLSPAEQAALCRMAVFRGNFTRSAALAVAPRAEETLTALLDKSMLVVEGHRPELLLRCPDTTRAYLLDKTEGSDAQRDAGRLHATYFLALLEKTAAGDPAEARASVAPQMGNVHAALDWAFSAQGDLSIGLRLALATSPFWTGFHLIEEGRLHLKASLAALGPGTAHAPEAAMRVLAALGSLSLLVASEEQEAAWRNCLAFAEQLGDLEFQLRALSGLVICAQLRNVREALGYARRYRALADAQGLVYEVGRGERIIANLLHVVGEQTRSREQLDVVLARYTGRANRRGVEGFHFDNEVMANCTHAALLWLEGFPEQALAAANAAVRMAEELGHEQSLFYAAAYCACPIALFCGDLDHVAPARDLLAGPLSVDPFKALWGQCFDGIEVARGGAVEPGLAMLRRSIGEMPPGSFGIRHPVLRMGLGECLLLAGRPEEALVELDSALAISRERQDLWAEPELVRLRGVALHDSGAPGVIEAFGEAVALARGQASLGWELRATTSLARARAAAGQRDQAGQMLGAIVARCTEGFGLPDLMAARSLLSEM